MPANAVPLTNKLLQPPRHQLAGTFIRWVDHPERAERVPAPGMPSTRPGWGAFYSSDTSDAAGKQPRGARRSGVESNLRLDSRNVPFRRAAHGPMTQRHAGDMGRAARNEAARRTAMPTGASGRSANLASAGAAS